jgi:hypothetical protein
MLYKLPLERQVFLGVFAKLQKATVNFAMPVRPSVHPSIHPH